MKQLAIFYRDRDNQEAINYIADNFYKILGDYVTITNYYTDEISAGQQINADVYAVCYEEMLNDLVGHIDSFSKVVVISRSIQQKYLKPIMQIPAGTNVLVINDSRTSTLQAMYMIFELGIGHLNLFPYEKSLADAGEYDNITVAIAGSGSESLIPKNISQIYNFHNREVSFETLHKVISLLDIKSHHIYNNLLKKVKDESDTNTDYINSYLGNILKDLMFSNIVEQSSRAIILLDKLDTIYYINEIAYKTFKLSQGDLFIQSNYLPDELAAANEFDGEIVAYNGSNYLVEKIDIQLVNNSIGYCLIFQNEKDLRKDENNLSRHLKQTGFFAKYTFDDIIHTSRSMQHCIETAKKVASSDYTILIRGESGTGKELLAQSIHNYSSRKNYPFVAVNCAAIPETLLESELFGYEEGAFTGAKKNGKLGLFEHAHHGTIFLDEIGDISPAIQASLLRVLQEKQIMKVGSGKIINIDTRIIAATNAALEKKVEEGEFRSDLFYRLNVITLTIDSLKKRKDDIMPLLNVFLGKQFDNLIPSEKEDLMRYDWPGNVRELENVASYYKIMNQLPLNITTPIETVAAKHKISNFETSDPMREDEDLNFVVLKMIAANSSQFAGIGRGALLKKLTALNITIGEGSLKKCMLHLKKEGLIYSESGRGGSHITQLGLDYINNMSKE